MKKLIFILILILCGGIQIGLAMDSGDSDIEEFSACDDGEVSDHFVLCDKCAFAIADDRVQLTGEEITPEEVEWLRVKGIEELTIVNSSTLIQIPNLRSIETLRVLDLRDNIKLACESINRKLPTSLEILYLNGCSLLGKLPDLRGFRSLRVLDIRRTRLDAMLSKWLAEIMMVDSAIHWLGGAANEGNANNIPVQDLLRALSAYDLLALG